MQQNMLIGVNEIVNFVECKRHSKEIFFFIIRETDSYIVIHGLSNLDSQIINFE